MFTHKCSCGKEYKDEDPEVYFCSECIAERKKIAEEVDKKMANRPKRQEKSDLQAYDELILRNRTPFVRAVDLGITL